jgi:hypothetical protein
MTPKSKTGTQGETPNVLVIRSLLGQRRSLWSVSFDLEGERAAGSSAASVSPGDARD